MMRRQIFPGLRMLAALTLLTGLVYPLVVLGVGQAAFSDRANGSLVYRNGHVVGSSLLAQAFTNPKYFQPRPSAAGPSGYDAGASGASNLGPSNPTLEATVRRRVVRYRVENGLGAGVRVPVDAVTASASGLDPDISVANARLQAPRVAKARGLSAIRVIQLVDEYAKGRQLAFLGETTVNVLDLNLALDRQSGP